MSCAPIGAVDRQWQPDMEETRQKLFTGWKKAVTRTFDWIE